MRVAQTRRCCEDQGMQKVRALGGNSPGCLQETLSGSSSICRSVDLGHSQSASSISPSNHLHCLLFYCTFKPWHPSKHLFTTNVQTLFISFFISKPSNMLCPSDGLCPDHHSLTHTSSHFGKEKLNMSLFQHILLLHALCCTGPLTPNTWTLLISAP